MYIYFFLVNLHLRFRFSPTSYYAPKSTQEAFAIIIGRVTG